MKKSICIWILLICNVTWAEAQMVSVVQRITVEKKVPAFYPVFNSDGSELLYTSENYKGLYLYKLNNKTSLMITDAEGAGYSPDFSQNNDKIYYRSVERENMHRQNTLMCYDRQLLQSKNCMNSPVHFQSELNKVRMGLEFQGKENINAYTEKLQLIVERNGDRKVLEPLSKGSRYLWGSLSPDKTKILFTATGKGTYICDLNGKILSEIGYLNAPVWYDDHKIVGMADKDNGDYITESSVVMVSADGKQRQVLSLLTEIAMYPTTNWKSSKIAYNTLEGEIIVLELKK
jgi:hypothetical protein